MKDKLKMSTKIFYGMGDFASNYTVTFLSFFIMIFLTDAMGMNSALIGTLMFASKLLDGVSDIIFGNLIDRTHTKWGKAKPWMFWSTFPLCIFIAMEFFIPMTPGTGQYVYFFIVYSLINAVFYTANNIAYSTLSALITRDIQERVQLGTIRFIFAFSAMMVLSLTTNNFVNMAGGGVKGWRTVAVAYAVFACVLNTISCLAVKELPEAEPSEGEKGENVSIIKALGALSHNRFFVLILIIYIALYLSTATMSGSGTYYATYVLGNPGLFGLLSMAMNAPMILGLFFVPAFVKKFGIYKANIIAMIGTVLMSVVVFFMAMQRNMPLLLAAIALRSLFNSPVMGTLNMLIAEIAGYTFRRDQIHIEGSVFSCASIGNKVGGGLGSALIGWLLAAGGYVAQSAQQTTGAITMITCIYAMVPLISFIIILLCCFGMNVQKANDDWDLEHGVTANE